MRRAINCAYCAPKSSTMTGRWPGRCPSAPGTGIAVFGRDAVVTVTRLPPLADLLAELCRHAPVKATAWGLLGLGQRGTQHDGVRPARDGPGHVAADRDPPVRHDRHIPSRAPLVVIAPPVHLPHLPP